jgi:hypothetical protein
MIPELTETFDRSIAFLRQAVVSLSDEEMVRQPPGVPNHAAWTLGHVIHSCEQLGAEVGVPSWLPSDWAGRFGTGSTPVSSAEAYPSREALVAALEDAAGRVRAALAALPVSGTAAPLPDVRAREVLPTVGHALVQVLAAHTAFHAGQLSVWCRAIGARPPAGFL